MKAHIYVLITEKEIDNYPKIKGLSCSFKTSLKDINRKRVKVAEWMLGNALWTYKDKTPALRKIRANKSKVIN